MKSLRSVLIAWFLFFSLVPVFLVTFFLIRSFDGTYRRETELRLVSVIQELESRIDGDQKFLLDSIAFWITEKSLAPSTSSHRQESFQKILRFTEQRAIDGMAVYSRNGVLSSSYQKDDEGKWVTFPGVDSGQIYYLPDHYLKKIKKGAPYFAIKTYPKRKVTLSIFQVVPGQGNSDVIVEVSRNITLSEFDMIRSRRQVNLMLLDGGFKIILSNWIEASKKVHFYQELSTHENELQSREIDGEEKLILLKKVKWGDSDLVLMAVSPKQTWNEAIGQIKFYVTIILIAVTFLLIIAVISVTSNIITPLKNLLGVTRKILYENTNVVLEAGPYDEITSLSDSIGELSRNIYKAQDELLKKISQLQETQSQLVQSEKLNSLGLLVAGIAHEINNPVGYIYSNIKPLKDHVTFLQEAFDEYSKRVSLDSSSEKTKSELHIERSSFVLDQEEIAFVFQDIPKLLQSFEEGSLRIKKIVNGLRTFSHQSSDRSEPVEVRQLLESTLVLLSHEFKSRDIKVESQDLEPCYIRGSMTELSQVLLNIFMNAAHAIKQNGVIQVRVKKVWRDQDSDQVAIEIQDNGPGISRDKQLRIFEPFYTTKAPGEGTGLGLSISYGIIQKHQGQIVVESNEGEGACFIILLPLYKEERELL
jgi:two-component system, NtrC family, sensor kinase